MIKILDKRVADKIAAGEVVDRPVSIVKELVENSIDAEATSITVEIKDGGKSYIRITDNGCGIDSEEVEIAFQRHATSKISTDHDLDAISSLGFRGEALASICAVSRVEIITKTAGARAGRRVIAEGSRIIVNEPVGCPDGTTITVRDLFYNVPARRKFLGTDGSESRRIIDLMSRMALAYPDIRLNLINSSKQVFTTTGKGNILDNIVNIYGTDIGRDLIPVDYTRGNDSIRGFISNPGLSMTSRMRQIYCVNGRIVNSKILENAIDKAYKERLFSGRFPVVFLFLTVPPETLDVNIHPTKREVRFDDNAEIEDFVYEAIIESLKNKESIPKIHKKPVRDISPNEQIQFIPSKIEKEVKAEEVDINLLLSNLRAEQNPIQIKEEITEYNVPFDFDDLKIIGSIFNTYILASDSNDFYMIDQHAAHERVFYEKLTEVYKAEDKYGQQLMMPLNFNVSADVTSTEDNWMSSVKQMGYDIEYFGNNTYIVREIPAFMELSEAEDFLNDLFNQFVNNPDLTDPSVMDKIIMRSCKSAVKAGDILTDEEIDALIEQLKSCNNPFSCPHGRPTFIRMTKYEIEKMFKRV